MVFHGDDCSKTNYSSVQYLSKPQTIANKIASKLVHADILVAHAKRYVGPFAVYESFISSLSSTGEPECYSGRDFSALSSLSCLLKEVMSKVESERNVSFSDSNSFEFISKPSQTFSGPLLLFGFSKGGVVLNQILAEISCLLEPSCTQNLSSSIFELVKQFKEIHFVDVGLNTLGAYLTDRKTLERLTKFMDVFDQSLDIYVHGTPKQWKDSSRPWIEEEKDIFVSTLQELTEGQNFHVYEKFYFQNLEGNLQLHFQIFDELDLQEEP